MSTEPDNDAATATGDGSAPPDKPRIFTASPGDRAQLAELAKKLLQDTGDEDEMELTPEEEQRLLDELQANYENAVRVFETKFVDLPSIASIRKLWREKKITDEDPVWTVVETLSLHDARSQLMLSQVMKVISTGHDLMRFNVRRVERVQRDLARVTEQTGKMEGNLIEAKGEVEALNDQLVLLGKAMPALLEAIAETQAANDTGTWRAKIELVGIGFIATLGGVAVGELRTGNLGTVAVCGGLGLAVAGFIWWANQTGKKKKKR